MKLINSSAHIIEDNYLDEIDIQSSIEARQESLLNKIFRSIEIAGRTCYKSEDRITSTSAKEFVQRMIDSKHNAMLEHGTVYLQLNNTMGNTYLTIAKYEHNKYSTVSTHECDDTSNRGIPYTTYNITTNYRVLVENNWLEDLKYLTGPTEFHKKRVMARFIIDRGISHKQFVA